MPVSAVLDILCGGGDGYSKSWSFIILESRLPAAVTALLSGVSLSVSGLLLQTIFRNPLAGPSVFGVNSGASLAVSVLLMSTGGTLSALAVNFGGQLAIVIAAVAGSFAVLLLIMLLSTVVRSNVMLLIIGMMVGYMASSVISVLSYFSSESALQAFTVWGLGTFASTTVGQLPVFALFVIAPLIACVFYMKPLNAMMLGENYAENLGYNVKRVRNSVICISGILAAVVTAFCGPIAFLGLAIPHLARLTVKSDNHFRLLPMCILLGANVTLFCHLLSILPINTSPLPINAITPLIGAPIIIWIILRK